MKALVFLATLAVCFGTFYKVWRQPDDFVEQMLAVYEDPGDLNRWLAEKGVLKWVFRLIVTKNVSGDGIHRPAVHRLVVVKLRYRVVER